MAACMGQYSSDLVANGNDHYTSVGVPHLSSRFQQDTGTRAVNSTPVPHKPVVRGLVPHCMGTSGPVAVFGINFPKSGVKRGRASCRG